MSFETFFNPPTSSVNYDEYGTLAFNIVTFTLYSNRFTLDDEALFMDVQRWKRGFMPYTYNEGPD